MIKPHRTQRSVPLRGHSALGCHDTPSGLLEFDGSESLLTGREVRGSAAQMRSVQCVLSPCLWRGLEAARQNR